MPRNNICGDGVEMNNSYLGLSKKVMDGIIGLGVLEFW